MEIRNIIRPLSILLTYILVPIILQRFGKTFRKLGVSEFTAEEVAEMKKIKLPKWVSCVNSGIVVGFLVLWLGLWFLFILKWFPRLQKLAFATADTIFFRGAALPYLLIILFSILNILAPLGGIITSCFPKYILYNYASMLKKNMGGMYRLKYTVDFYIKWLTLSFIIFMPLLFLSFQDYVSIDKEKIAINPFLSITEKSYVWDEVEYVKLHGYNTANEKPYLDIAFSDGKIFDVWGGLWNTDPGKQGIINLIMTAKEKNIPFLVEDFPAEKQGKLPLYASEVFDFAHKIAASPASK